MKQQRTAGFTLIELMIVVAIIAIIASVAIPRLMAARLSANESAAISTLRSLTSAQAQVQSSGAVDTDADGSGEYGYFAELAGTLPLRIIPVGGGAPALGVVGTDELNPAVLSAAFGNVARRAASRARATSTRCSCPPRRPVPSTAGIAEAPAGGAVAGAFPDPDNCEILWACYAWPIERRPDGQPRPSSSTRKATCFKPATRVPSVTRSVPTPAPSWPRPSTRPTPVANDMGSQLSISGAPAAAQDGNLWVPVQ